MRTDEQILKIVNAVLAGDKSVEDALPAVKADLEERVRRQAQTSSKSTKKVVACINKIAKEGAKFRQTTPGYAPFHGQYCFYNKTLLVCMNDNYAYPELPKPLPEDFIGDHWHSFITEDKGTPVAIAIDRAWVTAGAKIFKAENPKADCVLEFGGLMFNPDAVLLLCDTLKVKKVKVARYRPQRSAAMYATNENGEWGFLLGRRYEE